MILMCFYSNVELKCDKRTRAGDALTYIFRIEFRNMEFGNFITVELFDRSDFKVPGIKRIVKLVCTECL